MTDIDSIAAIRFPKPSSSIKYIIDGNIQNCIFHNFTEHKPPSYSPIRHANFSIFAFLARACLHQHLISYSTYIHNLRRSTQHSLHLISLIHSPLGLTRCKNVAGKKEREHGNLINTRGDFDLTSPSFVGFSYLGISMSLRFFFFRCNITQLNTHIHPHL